MRQLSTVLGFTIIALAGTAWGQAADKKPAEAKPAPAGGAPAGADMMKPPPELQQYKLMIGTWKCEGKGTMMGKEMKVSGTYKASWELDGAVVVAHAEEKAQGAPGSHKGMDVYGYDPTTKMFTSAGFDNFGGSTHAQSKGWEGDKQEWSGKGTMMGKEQDLKWTVTKKSDKEITISGGVGTDVFEETCKK